MRKLISWLLAAAMLLTLLPAAVFAAAPQSFTFSGDGTWLETSMRADNTKDYTLEFDVNLPMIAGVTGTDAWADEGKIIIRNESTDEYIYFRVMTYRNGGGQYQIASAANVWTGSDWSGEDFLWSSSYATPFAAVHMKIDCKDGAYSWAVTSTDGSVAICSGTVTQGHLREGILSCTSAQIRFYRNSNNMTVSNGVLTYTEATPGDEEYDIIFAGNGDWQETTVRADNTKDYTIDFDVNLPLIAGVTGTDAWGDEGKIIIRNESTDEYIYFRVMTYRNGGGQYQIASAANVWSGSSWSGEDFLWSSGYETPFTAVHMKIDYKDGAYSWAVTSTDGSVAICSGAVTPDHLREGILTCTSAQIRFYRNSNNMTVSNAKLRYSEATLQIVSAALRLDEDIDVIYTVNVPKDYTNAYMVINGTTISTSEAAGDYRQFIYTGLTPQRITDNITATLYATNDGVTESDTVANYSVKRYCSNLLTANPYNVPLKTLLSDLLTYGAAAQLYTNYNTDNPATSGLTLSPSTFSAISGKSVSFTGTADSGTYWSEATLVLGNTVGIRLYFYTDAQISIDVTINDSTESYDSGFVSCGNGRYYLDIPGIQATDFDAAVTAEFYDNGVKIGNTLGYSVNTYICGMQNSADTTLRALVRALYNYGVSAANYQSLKTPYAVPFETIQYAGDWAFGGLNALAEEIGRYQNHIPTAESVEADHLDADLVLVNFGVSDLLAGKESQAYLADYKTKLETICDSLCDDAAVVVLGLPYLPDEMLNGVSLADYAAGIVGVRALAEEAGAIYIDCYTAMGERSWTLSGVGWSATGNAVIVGEILEQLMRRCTCLAVNATASIKPYYTPAPNKTQAALDAFAGASDLTALRNAVEADALGLNLSLFRSLDSGLQTQVLNGLLAADRSNLTHTEADALFLEKTMTVSRSNPKADLSAKEITRYVSVGDSITEGACAVDPRTDAYAPLFASILKGLSGGKVSFVNRGISGTRMCTVTDNGVFPPAKDTVDEYIVAEHPDLLSVAYGINDYHAGTTKEEFLTTYAAYVEEIQEKCPGTIILLLSLTAKGQDQSSEDLQDWNAGIRAIAETHGCIYVDTYYDMRGVEWLLTDNLHPTNAGYRVMANAVLRTFNKYYNF